MATWKDTIVWSEPHSISQLTSVRGARNVIPDERGFYAFVEGWTSPSPERCLYIGLAISKSGLRGRLRSYLRTTVTVHKAAGMLHHGKKLLSFARIRGVSGQGGSTVNTPQNDKFIHVCWAKAPLNFTEGSANEREYAFMIERALIDFYRPLYNTADWERDLDFDLEDDAGLPDED